MTTVQPIWKFHSTVGDVNPIDYSGGFVYIDITGVYPPECEWIESEDGHLAEPIRWTVYRWTLERKSIVIGKDGSYLLVPYGYESRTDLPHPIAEYDEWFHRDLSSVAQSNGVELDTLRREFTSNDPAILAGAYLAIAQYHGFENLDSYPLTFTDRNEIEQRYKGKNNG
jgi:hypothetical protein